MSSRRRNPDLIDKLRAAVETDQAIERAQALPRAQAAGRLWPSGSFTCDVCVPAFWTDAEVLAFVGHAHPRVAAGWGFEINGSRRPRVPCAVREGCVHIMLMR